MKTYRVVLTLVAVLFTFAFVACVAGAIFFLPAPHTPGSSPAVHAQHKWVTGAIVSFIFAALAWEEAT